jgi:hypothetical protein
MAAVTLSFVRAHAAHPFASSILALIPTVMASGGEFEAQQLNAVPRGCSALIGTKFAQSHLQRSRADPPALCRRWTDL